MAFQGGGQLGGCDDLDQQPSVPRGEDLSWLEGEAEKAEWSVADADAVPVRPLTGVGLEAVAAGLPVPPSLRLLAERLELQRRIRSATARYLDLGDFAVAATAEDGYLMHVLSDQQWVRHWLLYLDAFGGEAVLTSREPIGFDLPASCPAPPCVIPIDSGAIKLEVCADSFAEGRALSRASAAYAGGFPRSASASHVGPE